MLQLEEIVGKLDSAISDDDWGCVKSVYNDLEVLLESRGLTLRAPDKSAIELLRELRHNVQIINVVHPDVLERIDAVLRTADDG